MSRHSRDSVGAFSNRTVVLALLLLVGGGVTASAGQTACLENGGSEEFHYKWRLRGGLSWIARIAFPTSGVAVMETSQDDEKMLSSVLEISVPSRPDFYRYESEIDPADDRTMMTNHSYRWGGRERHDRTEFDYEKGLSRRERQKEDSVDKSIRQIPKAPLMDVLTGIQFLRTSADEIQEEFDTEIYSDGKFYQVSFRPVPREYFAFGGETWRTRCFEIVAAKNAREPWSGGLKVCLTDDDRRIPFLISIKQGRLASLELTIEGIGPCDEKTVASVVEKAHR